MELLQTLGFASASIDKNYAAIYVAYDSLLSSPIRVSLFTNVTLLSDGALNLVNSDVGRDHAFCNVNWLKSRSR